MRQTSHVHYYILKWTLLFSVFLCSKLVLAGTFSVVPASDCNTCDGSATFTSSMNGVVNYEWQLPDGSVQFVESNSLGVSVISGLCAGVLVVVATDVDGSQEIQVVNVPINGSDPGISTEFLTCSDAAPNNLFFTLNGTPEAGGTWTDPAGNPSDGIFIPSTTEDGLYLYTINNLGCDVTSGVLVTTNQNADPGLSTTYLICETYTPFFLTDLLAGSPDYGGNWTGPGNVPIDGWFTPEDMGTGLFLYVIDTVPGCGPVFSTMFVIENFLPDPGLPTSIDICPNTAPFDLTLLLDGTPDMGGEWSDEDNNTIDNIFDPETMPAGVYIYEVNGITPCPDQETTITVGYTDGITAGDGGVVELCSLDDPVDMWMEIEGGPDAGGTWTNSLGDVVSYQFDPAIFGSGIFTYTIEAMGCQPVSSDLEITVEQANLAGDDVNVIFCINVEALSLDDLLINADPGGSWLDSFGDEMGPDILAEQGTTGYVYYQEGNFCPDDNAIVNVTFDGLPDAGPDLEIELCEDQPIVDLTELVPTPDGLEVAWTDPLQNVILPLYDPSSDDLQIFNYLVLSGNSCPDDNATLEFSSEAILFPDASVDLDLCDTEIIYDLNNDLPFENLPLELWQDAFGNTFDGVLDPSSITSNTYTYTFVNGDICPPSIFVANVEIFEQPFAGIDGQAILCIYENSVDLGSLLSGEDPGGYWSYDGSIIPEVFDPGVGEEGAYVYNLPSNGPCPATQSSVDIAVDPGVNFDAGIDISACSGVDPIQMGQDPDFSDSYSWSPPTNLNDENVSNPLVTMQNNTSEVQSINYIVTISNGVCELTDTVLVTVYPIPDLIVNPDFQVCIGEEFTLTVEGAATYEWQPGIFFDDNTEANTTTAIDQSTLFIVIGTSEWGCEAEESVLVEAIALPDVDFDGEPVVGCAPLQVQLINLSDVEFGANYIWVFGDGTISELENPVFIFEEAGTHDVSLYVQAVNGCSNELMALDYITVNPIPLASFHHNPTDLNILNSEILTQNTSIGGVYYSWIFDGMDFYDEESPTVSLPGVPGVYELCLTAINEFACEDTVCRSIYIAGEFLAYAPNAFTPDNDGINDVFAPVLTGYDPATYEFRIFDRWGELIFESFDPNEAWLGNHKNGSHYVQNDVYVWILSVRDLYTAEVYNLKGHVNLLR